MNSASASAESKRLNVLILDGGGIRGLSSLLILQALMLQINQALKRLGTDLGERHPQHVFQLVAGTSTGGLIAIMLGKLAMTVDDCITQYEELSKTIFGKKHHRSRITRGLAPARYSGKRLQKCIQDLLSARQHDVNMSMTKDVNGIACAVVCREHCSPSQYSKLRNRAVPICSLKCEGNLDCTICEAARATSAAPTFFPVMKIGDRFFADGGLEHNNPSFAIYFHYTGEQRKKSTRPPGATSNSAPKFSPHGDLDCSRVRFTNIGTGAKEDEVEPGKREWLAGLVPGIIRKGVFLKQTLTEIAVNSAKNAEIMAQFQELNPDVFMYERFDADQGVSNIKLDDYRALPEIKRRTKLYLEEQETIDMLEEVGQAIAVDYLNSQPIQAQGVALSNTMTANDSPQQDLSADFEPKTPHPDYGTTEKNGEKMKNSKDVSLAVRDTNIFGGCAGASQHDDMERNTEIGTHSLLGRVNSQPTQAQDMAPTNIVNDESHHPPKVPSLVPASSSMSTRPSSHSAYSDGGTHEVFPDYDGLQENGPTQLAESTGKAPLPLDEQDHFELLVHDDSDTVVPIALASGAPA